MRFGRILVTGGAGYVGAVLVPRLLARGHEVAVLDLCWYGNPLPTHPGLTLHRGDLRDPDAVRRAVRGCDAVIHLACISNDPSFELDPQWGRSINLDAFEPLVRRARDAGCRRFVYASSSSVYGVSDQPDVTESHPLRPLTDYSRFKAQCETVLLDHGTPSFVPVVVRPATVCGYSPRLRLDLTVNILTNHAVTNGRITVFGGSQKRPNIHIEDMCACYELLLDLPDDRVRNGIYNAGYHNHTLMEIAEIVRDVVSTRTDQPIPIVTTPTDDLRSYHISSNKIASELGFRPERTIQDAVRDLTVAFEAGHVPDSMTAARYYNVRTMKALVEA